jgi:hypothetical protein
MQRHQTSITLSVPPDTKERLTQLAQTLGILWGAKPSPSKLVAAIAEGKVSVGAAVRPDAEQLDALVAAVRLLLAQGEMNKAQALIRMTTARGGLPEEVLNLLFLELAQVALAWRASIEQAISRREPILVTYGGSKPEPSSYVARYAEFRSRMGQWYVDIRTGDGVGDSMEIPGLEENRCLRLDRVQKVAPAFHPSGWADEGLATVVADLRCFEDSAKYYKRHPDDLPDETVYDEAAGTRRVRRKVSNSWWFARDIVVLGPDVVVEGPPALVEKVRERLRGALRRYEGLVGG